MTISNPSALEAAAERADQLEEALDTILATLPEFPEVPKAYGTAAEMRRIAIGDAVTEAQARLAAVARELRVLAGEYRAMGRES